MFGLLQLTQWKNLIHFLNESDAWFCLSIEQSAVNMAYKQPAEAFFGGFKPPLLQFLLLQDDPRCQLGLEVHLRDAGYFVALGFGGEQQDAA